MKRFDLALLLGLVFSILLGSFSVFGKECDNVRDGTLRLHILANSDSPEDQALKLAVRDVLLENMGGLFAASSSKEEAKALAQNSIDEIVRLADTEIANRGYGYQTRAQVVNCFFPTRVYDGFTLPSGRYDAVQIEIGEGDGKNWWCMMFPPMCVPAASERSEIPLEKQIRKLGEPPRYKPAFAVVEALEELKEHLRETSK